MTFIHIAACSSIDKSWSFENSDYFTYMQVLGMEKFWQPVAIELYFMLCMQRRK